MDKEELLKIYKYIKICLWYHHGIKLNSRKLLVDIQHDIFLYLIDKKGVTSLENWVKRMIFIYAQYQPGHLKKHKYSSKNEKVLLDLDGDVIDDPGISYFPNGDTLYDIHLIESLNKTKKSKIFHNTKPILVTYITGSQEVFDGVSDFSKKLGCHTSTVTKWIRLGCNTRSSGNKDMRPSIQKKAKDKYGHIKKVEYLVP